MWAGTLLVNRVLLISSAWSTTTLCFSSAALASLGDRILRSLSKEFLTGLRYKTLFILSIALLLPAATVWLSHQTVYDGWVVGSLASNATILVMLRVGLDDTSDDS